MNAASIVDILPPGVKGIASVDHFEVTEEGSRWHSFTSRGRDHVSPGRYARLRVNGQLMMTDTQMERSSNWRIMRQCNGDVLIAGLGIGMVLDAVLKHPEVRSVTVIEKHQDVIDLVSPHYESDMLSVICADIMEWQPPKGRKWDTIYFDIWPEISIDNLADMATLHRRFASRLNRSNPKAWMDSWQKDRLVSERRSGRRRW